MNIPEIPDQRGIRIKGILLGNQQYDQFFDSIEEHNKWHKEQNDKWERMMMPWKATVE